MSEPIRDIVILGGGSAGWLTAGVLAAAHPSRDETSVRVTLVESPDVKTIGVGEGTWPSMRDTLRHMGVSEADFFRECDAAFKQASRFSGWITGAPDDHYYHPFSPPAGYGDINVVPAWSRLTGAPKFADVVTYQTRLCDEGRGPKQPRTPEFAAVANYAYHLDAGKFGEFLKAHCIEKLGVHYVQAHVQEVVSAESGDIAGLRTAEDSIIRGDLFIDCTGFASVLIGQHFGVPLQSTRPWLFCDTALALQVPHDQPDQPIAPYTNATAQPCGWIWDIGLPTRRGVGHVFSSDHVDLETAERQLLDYVSRTTQRAQDDLPAPRKLDLNPGYRETFWHRNCVAVGISAGFIEPLEASALALIELSAKMIADDLPPTRA
ncbi:MAG: tryptophan 7-halogenase, partial [Pseudomonadota bacterium]